MPNDQTGQPSHKPLCMVGYVMLGGIAVIALFSLNPITHSISNASIGMLIAGASALTGGLLGFLFGIPRVLQAGETIITHLPNASEAPANTTDRRNVSYGANTNLEQISDWLTKILVGVGLTQLNVIPTKLMGLAFFLSSGFTAVGHADVLASAILLYFLVCGFLFGYLWTRLFLPRDLRVADMTGLGQQINEIKKQVSELEEQASRDAKALSAVQIQLNPHSDSPQIREDELNNALKEASPSVKATIFRQAWEARSNNWRDNATKPQMERTIPIFRALIACDIDNKYHANHAQLGFALKDKRNPEWAEAEKELTKAIDIRGDWKTHRWLFYEFNRAICRIVIDDEFQNGRPSTQEARERILADLRAAASNEELRNKIANEAKISRWMNLNNIAEADIQQ
jgi:hypothetical protein